MHIEQNGFYRFFYRLRVPLLLLIVFISLSLYVIYLGIGNKSFLVLSQDKKLEAQLMMEIERLRDRNAALQKSLFELKSLEP